MNNAEILPPYDTSEIFLLIDSHLTVVRSVRTRVLLQQLGLPLKNFPFVSDQISEAILRDFENAQTGFRLYSKTDQIDDVLENILGENETNGGTLQQILYSFNSRQTLVKDNTKMYESAYLRAMVPLAHLKKNSPFAFKDVWFSMDDNDLGDWEETRSFWNTSPKGGFIEEMDKLKEWSRDILYDPHTQDSAKLLTVGHFFGASLELLSWASSEHFSD